MQERYIIAILCLLFICVGAFVVDDNTLSVSAPGSIVQAVSLDVASPNRSYSPFLEDQPENRRGFIFGYKYIDEDGDGAMGAGEEMLGGVEIFVDQNGNGTPDPGEPTTLTDASFGYGLSVPDGVITVCEVLPEGQLPMSGSNCKMITTLLGEGPEVSFGNYYPGEIHGTKYRDVNGNGVVDPGDTPVDQWSIMISGPDGSMSTTTMNGGQYWFTNLKPGSYFLFEGTMPDWVPTNPSSGTYSFPLESGEIRSTQDFLNKPPPPPPPPGEIHGQKYVDLDADGVFDNNEQGMDGVKIILNGPGGMQMTTTMSMDLNSNGTIEPHSEVGLFWFTNLSPGAYTLSEQIPKNMQISQPIGNLYNILIPTVTQIDYLFGNVADALDFGDLPDPRTDLPGPCPIGGVDLMCYRTLAAVQGAAHVIDPFFPQFFVLGTRIDGDPDGQPTALAHGDDINISSIGGVDDEDGFMSLDILPGGVVQVTVLVTDQDGIGGILDVFLDLNDDGVLNDGSVPGGTRDHVIQGAAVVNGVNIVQSPVGTFLEGDVLGYMRIRLSSDGVLWAWGVAPDGEVEDYTFYDFDFGDAPSVDNPERPAIPGGYPTLFTQNGAFHRISPGFMMGELNDGEMDGQPTDFADGDDNEDASDDEDGVRFASDFIPLSLKLTPGSDERTDVWGAIIGTSSTLEITTSAAGTLDLWADFNRDGDWKDEGEHPVDGLGVPAGDNDIDFTVPPGAVEGLTFIRVRLSATGDVEDDKFYGVGEVEDYLIQQITKTELGSPDDTDDANPGDGLCADLSGNCTLRAAITESNASGNPIVVSAELLGKNGRATLQPQSPYPAITGTILLGGNGSLEIDGSLAGAGANGFELQSFGNLITGTWIHSFGGAGISVNADNQAIFENTISNNGGAGITVVTGSGNSIRTNSIFDNGGLGIDLGDDGVTQNDVGDVDVGANGLQNAPTLGVVTAENEHIEGIISSIPDTEFTIDFFASPTCDGSGFGEGATYIGSERVTTNNLGSAEFNVFVAENPIQIGDAVTATATDPDGNTSEFSSCFFAVTTDIEQDEEAEIPSKYELFQNYPNPFNPVTNIRFAISNREWVNVEVYNILGRRIATLVDGYIEPGEFTVEFDASELPSGIYIYRMTAGSFSMSKQLTLLK